MVRTSEARRSFVAEPIRDKSVMELVGVGEILGQRLKAVGFDTVYIIIINIVNNMILL